VDGLLDRGWNLLLFPEGTRSRSGGTGRLRRGAAVLAARHHASIVPIRITGTRDAMPPGSFWPSRIRCRIGSRRHPVSIAFGDPIAPTDDVSSVIESVQVFFEGDDRALPPAAGDQALSPAVDGKALPPAAGDQALSPAVDGKALPPAAGDQTSFPAAGS
jgi:hypothetical protein